MRVDDVAASMHLCTGKTCLADWQGSCCFVVVYHSMLLVLMPAATVLESAGMCCAVLCYAQVEHQRQLRQLAEDEAQLTAQQLQLQAEKQAVAAAAGRQALQEQAQAHSTR